MIKRCLNFWVSFCRVWNLLFSLKSAGKQTQQSSLKIKIYIIYTNADACFSFFQALFPSPQISNKAQTSLNSHLITMVSRLRPNCLQLLRSSFLYWKCIKNKWIPFGNTNVAQPTNPAIGLPSGWKKRYLHINVFPPIDGKVENDFENGPHDP